MSYPKFHDMDIIVLRLRAGDTHAFQYILDQFCPALCYFASRLTDNESAAESIVEQTVLKLWNKRQQFLTQEAVKEFLYASTRDACFLYVKNWQQGIKDDNIWQQIWQETESYIQHEIIRAEVLRQFCNKIDQIPVSPAQYVHTGPNSNHR